MNSRRYASVFALILVVLVLGWAAYRWTHPVSTAMLQIHCTQFPADDTSLTQWLGSQPLVATSAVTRNNDTLTVNYTRHAADAGEFASAVLDETRQRGYEVKSYSISYNKNPFQ